MAEALAVIGIVSNVVQIADVGGRLLAAGWKGYKSVSGAPCSNTELESDTSRLKELVKRLGDDPCLSKTSLGQGQGQAEEGLKEIVSQCRTTADELLAILDDLQAKGGRHPKWKSIWNALRIEWKNSDIEAKKTRLDGYKRDISLILLEILKYEYPSEECENENIP